MQFYSSAIVTSVSASLCHGIVGTNATAEKPGVTVAAGLALLDKLAKLAIITRRIWEVMMSTLTFRNSQGALVDISEVPATRAKNEFGAILEKATHEGAVAITRHDTPKAVLLSYNEFESLVNARSRSLDNLGADFDELLSRMQTPRARKSMEAAFNASPARLGRAAVKAARKPR